ncbi:hypothetical protein P0D88_50110 [Paraburkholderia sp. RL18-103-BIB-C]|uniref:hypothetical protein n=1 Tax=Paraburkholderia sp. RL18-103-BIB-C TaxID=3031637 RepID=UPI0038B9B055
MLVEQSEQASFKRTSSKIHRNVRKIRAMTKYYVIPIDSDCIGYFGIKEATSPYDDTPWFCGGCPQAFGGNDQGGISETLYRETLEESHMKVSLVQGASYYKKVHEHNGMNFWVCTKFSYEPSSTLPNFLRRREEKYRETAGAVLKVDMAEVPTTNREAAATRVLQVYFRRTGSRPKPQSINQSLTSETAEAIRKAAEVVQSGSLP